MNEEKYLRAPLRYLDPAVGRALSEAIVDDRDPSIIGIFDFLHLNEKISSFSNREQSNE
jgi:hypothetical protein